MTTDLYPKVRRAEVGGGAIVGIAKGAGMIEPNLATMLVYLLTDLAVPRAELRAMLRGSGRTRASTPSASTATRAPPTRWSSPRRAGCPAPTAGSSRARSQRVCRGPGGGRGPQRRGRAARAARGGARARPSRCFARALGKAVVNAPLFKCAVAGNDPNVGRLVQAVGKHVGARRRRRTDLARLRLESAASRSSPAASSSSNPEKELALAAHLRAAELYASAPARDGVFAPPIDFPPHERCVEVGVDLGTRRGRATRLRRRPDARIRQRERGLPELTPAYSFTCTTFAGGNPLK